ncbi:phosphoglycolate phosphatase [Herbaspirillum sp. AP02]|uniref:phosphoglycolate phosphatase n=1 Tax=unclassified Herbaspirillum TaxID=2624150 RepID=UPI0018CA5964|nr:phosphoglycolate phosphatase [Herbaspirillum sp. AP02]MBG7618175.1 phosphoglycolate phosphatase [Herbaspirillum sp. AP02]
MNQHAPTAYEALIFDLDGTLIDSAPDIAAAVNAYLAEQGRAALEVEYVERFIGNGPRRLIDDILIEQGVTLSASALDAAVERYIGHYRRNPASHTRFFPHVREDLTKLHAAGIRLGICTNKPHALTRQILDLLELSPLVEVALGADAVPACKPDPGHLLAVAAHMALADGAWAYIGDTAVDQATAAAAGVPFFVVPWGGGSEVRVEQAQRLHRLEDLLSYRISPLAKADDKGQS